MFYYERLVVGNYCVNHHTCFQLLLALLDFLAHVVPEKTFESHLDSKQSILKEINPEYSLEGLMLKLKLQYFGHLM